MLVRDARKGLSWALGGLHWSKQGRCSLFTNTTSLRADSASSTQCGHRHRREVPYDVANRRNRGTPHMAAIFLSAIISYTKGLPPLMPRYGLATPVRSPDCTC